MGSIEFSGHQCRQIQCVEASQDEFGKKTSSNLRIISFRY